MNGMESGKPIDDDVNFIPVEINVIHTVTDFFIVFYLLSVHVLTEQKPKAIIFITASSVKIKEKMLNSVSRY